MKKTWSLILAAVMMLACLTSFAGCGAGSGSADLNVGAILIGDETEGYTLAHMNGMSAAVKALKKDGIKVNVQYKKRVPEDDTVATNANDLIASGCTLIVTNSYGHQFNFGDIIEKNPSVSFVSMTGDLAAVSGLPNYANAFTDVYESRYVSGVVAGNKLKELIDSGKLSKTTAPNSYDKDGNIKIGYVGAYDYAEVVSGYTAFFLGVKSVVPNVAMTVKYTNSWFSEEREAAVGEYLMGIGCVIIGQHADSTGAPAAVQKAHKDNPDLLCFSVGYNVSMLDAAPDVALTSATNNWEVYYETLFRACVNGEPIPQDWSEGYSMNAVATTEFGKAAPANAKEVADAAVKAISDGSLKVFDCSRFTVKGKSLSSYKDASGMNGAECIVKENGVSYFSESTLRSAPYFDIRIDGITEIASEYTAE